jgi:starch synthase
LADTIEDGKTGFLFRRAAIEDFMGAICRAFSTFASKRQLNTMRRQAMARPFDWRDSALSYGNLYQRIVH